MGQIALIHMTFIAATVIDTASICMVLSASLTRNIPS